MNIWKEGDELKKICEQEDVSHLSRKMNEELRNCFARMRESQDAKTAEAASQTDLVGEQDNDNRVGAKKGKKKSIEHRKKISEALKGRKLSKKHIDNLKKSKSV
jgi:hypothetical protein